MRAITLRAAVPVFGFGRRHRRGSMSMCRAKQISTTHSPHMTHIPYHISIDVATARAFWRAASMFGGAFFWSACQTMPHRLFCFSDPRDWSCLKPQNLPIVECEPCFGQSFVRRHPCEARGQAAVHAGCSHRATKLAFARTVRDCSARCLRGRNRGCSAVPRALRARSANRDKVRHFLTTFEKK